MKKFMLGIMLLLVPMFAVNASTSVDDSDLIDKIELTSKSAVAYNGKLEVSYKITPSDAKNLKLTWSVTGLKTGVTATFVNGNVTNDDEGTINVEFKNETEDNVKVKVVAYNYANNITKTVEVSVKSEEATTENVEELTDFITTLPEEVNSDNYDTVEKILGDIDTILEENDGLEDLLDETSFDKYNTILDEFNNFEKNNISTGTIITIVLLAISFVLGLFIVFKKEK